MTQRIGIETAQGMVYLGEECEFLQQSGIWCEAILVSIGFYCDRTPRFDSSLGIGYPIISVRPIAPKVKRPMTDRECYNAIHKDGAEWKSSEDSEYTRIGGCVRTEYCGEICLVQGTSFPVKRCVIRYAPNEPWQKFEVGE